MRASTFRGRHLLALAALSVGTPAMAGTMYWDHDGNGTWSVGNGTWSATSTRWIANATSGTATTWVDSSDAVVKNGTQTITVAGTITAGSVGADVDNVNDVTFNNGGSGGFTISGGAAAYDILTARGVYTFNVPIGGSEGLIVKGHPTSGTGAVFNLNNTYSGKTTIDAGRITVKTSGGLGATSNTFADGVEVKNQGGLFLDGSAGNLTITEAITLNYASLKNLAGNNIIAGDVTKATGAAINTIDVAANTSLEIQGVLSSTNTLYGYRKTGAGVLTLASNAATGAMNNGTLVITGGKLVVNRKLDGLYYSFVTGSGYGAMVATGGVLAGTGTLVSSANTSEVRVWEIADGSIAPGDVGVAGTLTLDQGKITFGSTSTLVMDLSSSPSSGNDLLRVGDPATGSTGSVLLDGTLSVNMLNGGLSVGQYDLIRYKGNLLFNTGETIANALSVTGLPAAYSYNVATRTVSSTEKYVVLNVTAVPEPAGLSFLALGGIGVLSRRQRKDRRRG